MIFLAGLKGIPVTLYEAAMLDGAGAWSRFRNITLPMMTPVILYDLILGLSLGLQVFTQAYVITQRRPGRLQPLLRPLPLRQRLPYGKMGYASAMAWILFVITFVLALLIFRWSRRWVHYETHVGQAGERRWPGSNRWRAPQPCRWTATPRSRRRGGRWLSRQLAAAGRAAGSC